MSVKQHTAFTLTELAVTLAIVSILALIVAPAVRDAITHARIASAKNNLRILRDGLEAYASDYGRYPSGSTVPSNSLISDFDSSIVFQSLLGVYLPNNPLLLEDDFSRETMKNIKQSIAFDPSSIPDVVGYSYFDYMNYHVPPWTPLKAFALVCVGPDAKDSGLGIAVRTPFTLSKTIYSPSNGVHSEGDIGVANVSLREPLLR